MHMKQVKQSILILIVFIIALTGSIYAWFEITQTQDLDLEPGSFEVTIDVLFNDVSVVSTDEFYDSETRILTINAYDTDSDNYINKLKIQIAVDTHNSARVRVRIQDEWIVIRDYLGEFQTTRIIPGNVVDNQLVQPFNIHSNFFQVDGDPHYYYEGIINKLEPLNIVFLNGGIHRPIRITDTFTETIYVRFSIYVDVVQANRFAEVWNVSDTIFD